MGGAPAAAQTARKRSAVQDFVYNSELVYIEIISCEALQNKHESSQMLWLQSSVAHE